MYFPPEIDKKFILSRVSEEEIFEYYGVQVVNYPFCSPLRPDRNPTCTFYRSRRNDKLYMRDWRGDFWGDCFDLVCHLYNITFYEALRKIASDFGLVKDGGVEKLERVPAANKILPRTEYPDIRVQRRAWKESDYKFWGRWDFSVETLEKFRVSPAQRVWMDERPVYLYRPSDPAYIYHFGGYEYKIYFPMRDERRFLHGNPLILQGFLQLPEKGEVCLITKSYKDVMKLHEFDIPAVAPMSEAQIPTTDQHENLARRFKHLFSLYDTDERGVKSMQKMKRQYGIPPLFFPRSLPTKDFTDFYEHYGKEDTLTLVETIQSNIL